MSLHDNDPGVSKAFAMPAVSSAPPPAARPGLQLTTVQRRDGHQGRYWKRADKQQAQAKLTKPIGLALAPKEWRDTADTQHVHSTETNDGARIYKPQRSQLHEKIIGHYMGGGGHGDEHQKLASLYDDYAKGKLQHHAVYTMGGPGSGKSYISEHKFLPHPRFVHIDSDSIKEHLAEAEGKPGNHNTDPGRYHQESRDIAEEIHRRSLEQGRSFVYDSTGTNPDMVEKMQSARSAGHQVSLHFIKVKPETALDRNRRRARSLPDDVVIGMHQKVGEAFNRLKPLAHRVKVVDNSEVSKSIRLVLKRRGAALLKSIEQEQQDQEMDKLHLTDSHHILGYIKDGKIHVHDIVHNGQSERAVTGKRPDLHPISLADLRSRGFNFRTEKVKVKAHLETDRKHHNQYWVHEHERSRPK